VHLIRVLCSRRRFDGQLREKAGFVGVLRGMRLAKTAAVRVQRSILLFQELIYECKGLLGKFVTRQLLKTELDVTCISMEKLSYTIYIYTLSCYCCHYQGVDAYILVLSMWLPRERHVSPQVQQDAAEKYPRIEISPHTASGAAIIAACQSHLKHDQPSVQYWYIE
jgi:hypothetical protein